MIDGSSPGGGWEFSFHRLVQTGSGAHSASYPMGTGAVFLGVKRPGHEADHSPPSSAEVKNVWSLTSTLQYNFMVSCSIKSTGATLLYVLSVGGDGSFLNVTAYGMNDRSMITVRCTISSSPPRPFRCWRSRSVLTNGYQGIFPRRQAVGA
jgi:hypothetical protein